MRSHKRENESYELCDRSFAPTQFLEEKRAMTERYELPAEFYSVGST
ncbi:MAG: hypothetical protein ACYTXA_27605 [Nostoc sp.]